MSDTENPQKGILLTRHPETDPGHQELSKQRHIRKVSEEEQHSLWRQ